MNTQTLHRRRADTGTVSATPATVWVPLENGFKFPSTAGRVLFRIAVVLAVPMVLLLIALLWTLAQLGMEG